MREEAGGAPTGRGRRRVLYRPLLPCGNYTRRVVRIPRNGGPSPLGFAERCPDEQGRAGSVVGAG